MSVMFSDEEEKAFRESGFGEFPDGSYKGAFKKAEVKMIGQQRSKKLILTYLISAPVEYAGKSYSHFLPLDNQRAYGFVKATLAKFDCSAGSLRLSDIETEMQAAAGKNLEVEFALITNGKYQNAQIENVGREVRFPGAMASEDVDDDLPF